MEDLKCGTSQVHLAPTSLGCSIFGLAGDLHFLLVKNSAKMADIREQYLNFSLFDGLKQSVKTIVNGEFSKLLFLLLAVLNSSFYLMASF